MVYSVAKFQQSNTYQYPTDKKVQKLFEVPMYKRFLTSEVLGVVTITASCLLAHGQSGRSAMSFKGQLLPPPLSG